MENKIGFYQEVEISPDCKETNKKYAGKKGGGWGQVKKMEYFMGTQ